MAQYVEKTDTRIWAWALSDQNKVNKCNLNAMHGLILRKQPVAGYMRVQDGATNEEQELEPRMLAILDGIVPFNLLKSRYKLCNDDMDPIMGGMVPES